MHFTKLLTKDGAPVTTPEAVEGSVSFDAKDGVAQAWAADGKSMLASMDKARVAWIGAKGMRLEGMEPFERGQLTHYRAMEWQVIF